MKQLKLKQFSKKKLNPLKITREERRERKEDYFYSKMFQKLNLRKLTIF
jgi:hypothetical protein